MNSVYHLQLNNLKNAKKHDMQPPILVTGLPGRVRHFRFWRWRGEGIRKFRGKMEERKNVKIEASKSYKIFSFSLIFEVLHLVILHVMLFHFQYCICKIINIIISRIEMWSLFWQTIPGLPKWWANLPVQIQ